jgi:hypothetical protein
MAWLLDCWFVHKGHDFLDCMKETHPNILVTFILANYTNVLKLANVILLWPIIHAFKVQFNYVIITIIKQQIGNNQNSQIDFKMNNLNPRICEWLHCAWKQVQNMEETIVKGWDMTILPRHSKVNFSLLQWRQIQPLPY